MVIREQHSEELEDRMKCIAAEIKMEKEPTKADNGIPVSKKEPSPEHLLLREHHNAAMKFEKAMAATYTEGQVAEILSKIMQNVSKPEFPSEAYHNWTQELMDDAKTGWQKFKALQESLHKYPQQNMEQMYRDDTDEWIMLDRSGMNGRKRKERD